MADSLYYLPAHDTATAHGTLTASWPGKRGLQLQNSIAKRDEQSNSHCQICEELRLRLRSTIMGQVGRNVSTVKQLSPCLKGFLGALLLEFFCFISSASHRLG